MPNTKPPETFIEVLRFWPSISEVARDLELPYERVSQWAKRDSIPAEYWQALVRAAAARGFKFVSLPILVELASTSPSRPARDSEVAQ